MILQLTIMSKLLNNTISLLLSGYVAFVLSVMATFFYGGQTLELWAYLLVIFLLLFMHHYVSIRVKFDVDLILFITETGFSPSQSLDKATEELDQALIGLKLIPLAKVGRSWQLRLKGCLKLFKLQILLLILQYLTLIVFIGFLCNQ
ncbi:MULTISPECIES: hypothetical protein [unclassified Acinetobacter]|uniref:hypothetical protein n=1 Tax=unclassified Acinetobacter TaxID=196816 RepID=UPI00190BECA9|nr:MULTISPECIES: hypothetical protein [unclassified Acinetobacter]MBK0063200.1 hypothetical protein [Acinetobacter sp. S55]MBK0066888.1 hypothetical protein [Acinetobacter sp. S54]